jgi:hypothetical protein
VISTISFSRSRIERFGETSFGADDDWGTVPGMMMMLTR